MYTIPLFWGENMKIYPVSLKRKTYCTNKYVCIPAIMKTCVRSGLGVLEGPTVTVKILCIFLLLAYESSCDAFQVCHNM